MRIPNVALADEAREMMRLPDMLSMAHLRRAEQLLADNEAMAPYVFQEFEALLEERLAGYSIERRKPSERCATFGDSIQVVRTVVVE